jgi:HAE1 family hydrophobic/amphiphilic exporter-1
VDFINQMRRQGMSIREAIIAAGHARFRPILINSITAILGLLPMALGIGAGGALQAPLAVAVLGGLFSATALTLIVVPVAYEVLEGAKELFTGQRAVEVQQPAAGQALMAQDGHD